MASSKNTFNPFVDHRRKAMRSCIIICLTNGWAPPAEAIWRLMALREAWLVGERNESLVSDAVRTRLHFVKWLFENGKMGS